MSNEFGARIEALISPEGERLVLQNPVNLLDYTNLHPMDVEAWMMELEKQMRIAVSLWDFSLIVLVKISGCSSLQHILPLE